MMYDIYKEIKLWLLEQEFDEHWAGVTRLCMKEKESKVNKFCFTYTHVCDYTEFKFYSQLRLMNSSVDMSWY